MNDYLAHHGILGQKWGVRRFQNADGSLTPRDRHDMPKIIRLVVITRYRKARSFNGFRPKRKKPKKVVLNGLRTIKTTLRCISILYQINTAKNVTPILWKPRRI